MNDLIHIENPGKNNFLMACLGTIFIYIYSTIVLASKCLNPYVAEDPERPIAKVLYLQ